MNLIPHVLILSSILIYGQTKEDDMAETWAANFGDELWDLGQRITRAQSIRSAYKGLNARVLPTDGEGILQTIVSNVEHLLMKKMEAVACVIEKAEELAQEFEYNANETYLYNSAKFSSNRDMVYVPEGMNASSFKEMALSPDQHFYGIPVNTSYSAVHVPTDVYDEAESVQIPLQWSEGLDEVFQSNYESDPTMSWQYFGSSTGFLRHYPALHWQANVDMFDCRTRFWYIEAATCTKDVVILVDNTGSMEGMRNTIARLTVGAILDTLSNNDFINIFSYNMDVKEVVPCFPPDTLVQATPENIQSFKKEIQNLDPDDKADLPKAFGFAFNLLEKIRENKTCPDNVCNQAIMLVTDNVPDNLTEVFEAYNWFDNRTRIPVRVFTYLIGREVTNVMEIQYLACMNRGYFVHIKSLEEARSQALKYISVIARPLVLQAVEHPLSWTHIFVDQTGGSGEGNQNTQFRFMTSVSGPAFDTRVNQNNETRMAELLGVAGTDVLISDIIKLTLPYKIGANGYAFAVTNNGYILFHPDFRPASYGVLKENYNSVDLTEVELLDDDCSEPRSPSDEILQLREDIVSHKEGSKLGLKMKFQYDNGRRVGVETRNYYYAPINNTPFTIGIVLPDSYGSYWIKASDEIRMSKQMGIPIKSYFKGNWRIHPEWSYCNYLWSSKKGFNSPEENLNHFLELISNSDWNWNVQFKEDMDKSDHDLNITANCQRRSIDEDEYYCDQELMQLLVFDAKVTDKSFKTADWVPQTKKEQELAALYEVSVRFVSSQSGLTRWQTIMATDHQIEFGNEYNKALDEVWYKSAVLHHHLDPDAFVFSVPFDSGALDNITVTATHAIFPKDGVNEAPGAVVGFQLQHSALYERFKEITSKSNCEDCVDTCASDALDCYVIDGNGYILLSETKNDTGRFFGEVEGAVMEAMLSKNIFKEVIMFDYQALCSSVIEVGSGVGFLENPFQTVFTMIKWILAQIFIAVYENKIFAMGLDDLNDDYYDENFTITGDDRSPDDIPKPFYGLRKMNKTEIVYESCDKVGNLYLLQHLSKEGYHSPNPENCSRPFYMKRIRHTNLLLIVVNTLHQSCYRKMSSRMEVIQYNETSGHPSCQKLYINALPRRRLSGCFNSHPLEEEIMTCGRAGQIQRLLWPIFILLNYLIKLIFLE